MCFPSRVGCRFCHVGWGSVISDAHPLVVGQFCAASEGFDPGCEGATDLVGVALGYRPEGGKSVVAVDDDGGLRTRQQLGASSGTDSAEDIRTARYPSQGPTGSHHPANGAEVLATHHLGLAGRGEDLGHRSGMTAHSGLDGLPGKPLGHLSLPLVVSLISHRRDATCVDEDSEVALDGSLSSWFGVDHPSRPLRGSVGDAVDVGGGATYVDHYRIAHGIGEQLSGEQHGSWGRQDLMVSQLGQAVHAWGGGDVIVEDVVYDGAHRFNTQYVDVGEDVLDACQWLAGIGEDGLDVSPDTGVPGVDNWHPKLGGRNDLRVLDDDTFFSVIDPTGQQNDVGVVLLEIFQVELVHRPDGGHSDDGPGAQGCLARSSGRHGAGQTVDAHAQSSGRRGVHEDLLGGQR